MKKIFNLVVLMLTVCIIGEALTRREIIQEKLSGIGISQEIINETIDLEYEIKDMYIYETDTEKLKEYVAKFENVYSKDERNYVIGEKLAMMYIFTSEEDLKKAKSYIDKNEKYFPSLDNLILNTVYYKVTENEKKSGRYYKKIQSKYKGTPLMDFVDEVIGNWELGYFVNHLYEDNETTEDLWNALGKGTEEGISDYPDIEEVTEEEVLEELQIKDYKEGIKEMFDFEIENSKSEREEIEKIKRIVNYLKPESRQLELAIADDTIREMELRVHSYEMTKAVIEGGYEKAAEYYLKNVSKDEVSEDAIMFNKEFELELFMEAVYMLSITGDRKIIDKYSKGFEETRVIKVLEKLNEEEEKKLKSEKEGKVEEVKKEKSESESVSGAESETKKLNEEKEEKK